jgi:hypothetical protein
MIVESVAPFLGELVMFTDFDTHIRYSADNWVWCIGESTEVVYDCTKLETAYQLFKRTASA